MFNIEMSIFQIMSIGLFGLIFGSFEASTNLFYLITKNYDLPRKQHSRELPENVNYPALKHLGLHREEQEQLVD